MRTLFTLLPLAVPGRLGPAGLRPKICVRTHQPGLRGQYLHYGCCGESPATAQNRIQEPVQATAAADPRWRSSRPTLTSRCSARSPRAASSPRSSGQGAIKPGSYTVGAYQAGVAGQFHGVVVTVTDTGTGNQTTITIPNGL
ncbi:MAG: curli assembly protein CsgF [Hymenobacter sp.]